VNYLFRYAAHEELLQPRLADAAHYYQIILSSSAILKISLEDFPRQWGLSLVTPDALASSLTWSVAFSPASWCLQLHYRLLLAGSSKGRNKTCWRGILVDIRNINNNDFSSREFGEFNAYFCRFFANFDPSVAIRIRSNMSSSFVFEHDNYFGEKHVWIQIIREMKLKQGFQILLAISVFLEYRMWWRLLE